MGLEREIDRIYRESLEADYEAISRTAQPTGHYTLRGAMGSVDFTAVQAVPVNHVCLGTRSQLYTITSCTLRLVTPENLDEIRKRREKVILEHLDEPGHARLKTSKKTKEERIAEEDAFTAAAKSCCKEMERITAEPHLSHHAHKSPEQVYQTAYEALRGEGPTFSMQPKATELPNDLPSHGNPPQSFDTYPVVTFENVDYIHSAYLTPERFKSLVAGGLLKVPEDGFADRWPEIIMIEKSIKDSGKAHRATAYLRSDLLTSGWKNRSSTNAMREALNQLFEAAPSS